MTNTLLPPRPPPARGAKNYSAASRRGDTSATAAAAIATSLSAAARRAILIPGDEKQVLLGKYQSSTLLKPSAPHHCRHRTAATVPPPHRRARSKPVQLEHGTAAGRGGTDRPAVSPAAAPPLLLGWSRAVIPGLPQQQTSALQHPPPPFSTKYTMLSTLYAQWSKIINNGQCYQMKLMTDSERY